MKIKRGLRKHPQGRPQGWDARDSTLWAGITNLPSYGLVSQDPSNPLIARKDVERLLENLSKRRPARAT